MIQLYERLESYFEHKDSRGSIVGILNKGEWREVNWIKSDAGAVRGGHYHKLTKECFLILSGAILVKFRKPVENGQDIGVETTFHAGDIFIVKPYVEHTFTVLEDSSWINLLSSPMDAANPDFYKY